MGGRDTEEPARKRWSFARSGCHTSIEPERVLASVLDRAPVGLALVDAHAIRMLSRHGRALLGDAADTLGVLRVPAARALGGEVIDREEWVHRAADGSERTLVASGWPVYEDDGSISAAMLTFHDAGEGRRGEDQVLRAQRLESLGLLAGGIAHDFNNILTSIFGNIEIARLHSDREDVSEALALAEKAFDQARDLAQQLLVFARGGASLERTMPLAGLVTDTVRFALHGSNVRPEFRLDGDLWPAKIDVSRIGQAIQNIVINAKHAMADGGALRVEAKNAILAEDNPHGLPAGRYLKLSFEDEGVGIADEDIARVFDPYFTRRIGGTGLGLASTLSIVRAHRGAVSVDSRLGEGTTFAIFLPASDEPEAEVELERPPVARVAAKGTILLMDDDEAVRRVGTALLARLGFEAKLACDGAEALALYRQAKAAGRPFLAVILDLTVPGAMGGTECLRHLRALDPDVKALVSTGYASDLVMSEHEEYGFRGVVPKPYRLADLSNALAEVLSSD